MKRSSLLLILAVSLLTACHYEKKSEDKETNFTNSQGEKITLKKEPQRIISCSPVITEVIYALHEEDKLVGRTSFCNYPPEAEKITAIGGLVDPSLEMILQLKPDLVMASTHFKRDIAKRIEQLDIPFAWLMNQKSIDGAGELILNIGTLIGAKTKAKSLWKDIQADIKQTISLIPNNQPKPTVYYVIGYGKGGDYTAGGDTFISELITLAGGINIAADVKGWNYNLETLMQKNPDIILIQESMLDAFCQHDHYKDLKAVKNNHVYAVDHHLVQLNGPRIHLALHTIAKIFYPNLD